MTTKTKKPAAMKAPARKTSSAKKAVAKNPASSKKPSQNAVDVSNPVGRPSKYRPEYAKQAAKLCALGATDAQLADFFDVAVSTVQLWKVQHPEFSDSIRVPKAEADDRVEQSLYRRALGYEHDEVDIRTVSVGQGMSEIVQTPIRKHYPPDTTAAMFWLKNRRSDKWRDKVEADLNHSGAITVNIKQF